jgi:hypothetical protein
VVNGSPVSLSEVEAVVRRSNQTPRQALRSLEAEQLLMQEADKSGYYADPEVAFVGKQAAVQQLLIEQVEQQVRVTDEDLEAAYERDRSRFQQPERRASVHILAKLRPTVNAQAERQAEALAREAIAAFAKTAEVEAALALFRDRSSNTVAIVAEHLPPISRDAAIAAEYKEALFSQPGPGVIKQPIRTSYGWHAIYLTEIIPAITRSLQEVTDLLAPQIKREKQYARMQSLLDRARRSTRIVKDQSAIQWLMNAELSAVFQ